MNEAKTELMRRIFKTTIPSELQVMYLLAQGLDILINDVDRRMANQCRQAGLDVKHGFVGEDKSKLAQFSKSIKQAKYWFERMEPLVNQYTFGEGGVAGYDSFRADANEIVRMILMYCNLSKEDARAMLADAASKEGVGMFNKQDFERFHK